MALLLGQLVSFTGFTAPADGLGFRYMVEDLMVCADDQGFEADVVVSDFEPVSMDDFLVVEPSPENMDGIRLLSPAEEFVLNNPMTNPESPLAGFFNKDGFVIKTPLMTPSWTTPQTGFVLLEEVAVGTGLVSSLLVDGAIAAVEIESSLPIVVDEAAVVVAVAAAPSLAEVEALNARYKDAKRRAIETNDRNNSMFNGVNRGSRNGHDDSGEVRRFLRQLDQLDCALADKITMLERVIDRSFNIPIGDGLIRGLADLRRSLGKKSRTETVDDRRIRIKAALTPEAVAEKKVELVERYYYGFDKDISSFDGAKFKAVSKGLKSGSQKDKLRQICHKKSPFNVVQKSFIVAELERAQGLEGEEAAIEVRLVLAVVSEWFQVGEIPRVEASNELAAKIFRSFGLE